jgi:hypothetical protein
MLTNRRLYTDASRTLLLEDADSRTAWLLVGENSHYTQVLNTRYGIDEYLTKYPTRADAVAAGIVDEGTMNTPMKPEPEQKAVAPVKNKAVSPKSNK